MSTRTTFGDHQGETAHKVFFTLHNAGEDLFFLETGEVFKNPRYASVRGKERMEIFAHLNVRPATDERDPEHTSDMRYYEGGDDAPFLNFGVYIPASDYSLLLSNIRGGIMPSSVTVGFRDDPYDKGSPIEFGNAPDGSEIIWRNAMQQNRCVDVESIEFHYGLIGDVYGDEDTKPPTAKASIDAASVAVVSKLADLEKIFVKGVGVIVTAIIVACAVLYFARH